MPTVTTFTIKTPGKSQNSVSKATGTYGVKNGRLNLLC